MGWNLLKIIPNDLDVLFLVPNFNFKINFMYKEKQFKHEIELNSLDTIDVVYEKICNHLQLNPKRILSLNEYGLFKYNQWVESANLFLDNMIYVIDTVKDVDHGILDQN